MEAQATRRTVLGTGRSTTSTSRARGRERRAVAISTLVLALVGTMFPPARADVIVVPTPVTVTGVGPVEGEAVLVQRSAGPVAGRPDGWRLNMDVILRNDGLQDVTLEEVRITYTGGSGPSDLVVPTDPDAPAPWVIEREPRDLEQPEVVPAETILAGGSSRRARVPEDRVLSFPLPAQITVQFTFAEYDLPVSVTRPLAEYVPPAGPLAFPFAGKDLDDGTYVATGQNHRFGSAHRRTVSQRFGEDFQVVRWDETEATWTTVKEGQSGTNESRLVWGKPVYAMADGIVTACNRSSPDNPAPGQSHPDRLLPAGHPDRIPGGGNSLWIQHAPGEYTLYAHFKEGSVPADLCPDAADDGGLKYPPGVPGAIVKAGRRIGDVGNSGRSGGPHLHLHTQKGASSSGNGRPLIYQNIRVVDAAAYDPGGDDDAPWRSVDNEAVTISGRKVNGTEIGGFAGYGIVGRMLVAPQPRANLELTTVGDPHPVAAGTQLSYTSTIVNHGPDPAEHVLLANWLPDEVEFVADDGGCFWGPGARVCFVGDLAPGEHSPPITMTVLVPPDLVYDAGGPFTLTNTAIVSAVHGPFEATPQDNEADEDTPVVAVADLRLAHLSADELPPTQLLVGEDASVNLHLVVSNAGPSWPMDVRVDIETDAQPSPGVVATPSPAITTVHALKLDEMRAIHQELTLTCIEPGSHEVSVSAAVEPSERADSDPNARNNEAQLQFVIDCVTPIAVNIRPGNSQNQLPPNGIVPVAALTTDAGEYGLPLAFDATAIIPESLRFGDPAEVWAGTGGAPPHGEAQVKDAHEPDDTTKDGDPDLYVRFGVQPSGLDGEDTQACMKGLYQYEGKAVAFFGCDAVTAVPPQ